MASCKRSLTCVLLFIAQTVCGFLFDGPCESQFHDFQSYLLKGNKNVSHPVFFRHSPLLVREIAINAADCPAFKGLMKGNFSVKFLDAADPVLGQMFKTLSSSIHSSSLLGPYDMVIRFHGGPLLSRMLKIESNIQASCSPDIIVKGCQLEDKLCISSCSNGGKCVGLNKCNCYPGRAGNSCQTQFTIPGLFDMSLNKVSHDGLTAMSTNGEFILPLQGDIEYQDIVTSKRDVRDIQRRGPHDHHHHHEGALHLHGHGGRAHCSHHGHDCHDVLGHEHPEEFTTSAHYTVSSGHNGHTTLYATNVGPGHVGASLVHEPNGFQMNVNDGHVQCNLNVPHALPPNTQHNVVSSFSPQYGCSLYVNGHHIGSQSVAPAPPSQPKPQQQFCVGECGASNNGDNFNATLSNLLFVAGSLQNMVTNGIASILGGILGSIFKPQSTTTTRPKITTVKMVTQTHFNITTTSSPAPTMRTTTSSGLTSSPICFNCGPMAADGQCKTVKMCPQGEICLVFEDQGKFTHRCLEKNTCYTAQKTVTTGCWECCSGYLCNENCPVPCDDTPVCASVKSTGYNVCGDQTFADKNCRKSCNICP